MKKVSCLFLAVSVCSPSYALEGVGEMDIAAEEWVIIGCGFRAREVPIFFEESSVFFNQELLDSVTRYSALYPEECEDYKDQWYCAGNDISNVLTYRGVSADGEEMNHGFLCHSDSEIPSHRYYSTDTFEGVCVEVVLDSDDEASVFYPHDYE